MQNWVTLYLSQYQVWTYNINILAHTASRFIKTLGKYELWPNERTVAKDKTYDLE